MEYSSQHHHATLGQRPRTGAPADPQAPVLALNISYPSPREAAPPHRDRDDQHSPIGGGVHDQIVPSAGDPGLLQPVNHDDSHRPSSVLDGEPSSTPRARSPMRIVRVEPVNSALGATTGDSKDAQQTGSKSGKDGRGSGAMRDSGIQSSGDEAGQIIAFWTRTDMTFPDTLGETDSNPRSSSVNMYGNHPGSAPASPDQSRSSMDSDSDVDGGPQPQSARSSVASMTLPYLILEDGTSPSPSISRPRPRPPPRSNSPSPSTSMSVPVLPPVSLDNSLMPLFSMVRLPGFGIGSVMDSTATGASASDLQAIVSSTRSQTSTPTSRSQGIVQSDREQATTQSLPSTSPDSSSSSSTDMYISDEDIQADTRRFAALPNSFAGRLCLPASPPRPAQPTDSAAAISRSLRQIENTTTTDGSTSTANVTIQSSEDDGTASTPTATATSNNMFLTSSTAPPSTSSTPVATSFNTLHTSSFRSAALTSSGVETSPGDIVNSSTTSSAATPLSASSAAALLTNIDSLATTPSGDTIDSTPSASSTLSEDNIASSAAAAPSASSPIAALSGDAIDYSSPPAALTPPPTTSEALTATSPPASPSTPPATSGSQSSRRHSILPFGATLQQNLLSLISFAFRTPASPAGFCDPQFREEEVGGTEATPASSLLSVKRLWTVRCRRDDHWTTQPDGSRRQECKYPAWAYNLNLGMKMIPSDSVDLGQPPSSPGDTSSNGEAHLLVTQILRVLSDLSVDWTEVLHALAERSNEDQELAVADD